MEAQKLHEIIRPAREIGHLVVGWAKDIICPPEALEWSGAASEMPDQELYEQPQIPNGDWDSLRGV